MISGRFGDIGELLFEIDLIAGDGEFFPSETDPVPMSKLLERTQLLPADLFNAVQSLGRRSLIEKPAGNLAIFTLQPVLKEYVKCQYTRT